MSRFFFFRCRDHEEVGELLVLAFRHRIIYTYLSQHNDITTQANHMFSQESRHKDGVSTSPSTDEPLVRFHSDDCTSRVPVPQRLLVAARIFQDPSVNPRVLYCAYV